MQIKLRFEFDQRRFEEDFKKYIDRIHETFRDEMIGQLSNSGPRMSGMMRESWEYRRDDLHHSTVFNNTPQAGFLQGTGVWNEGVGHPVARKIPYYWKATGRIHTFPMVRGINPHKIAISVDKDLLKLRNQQLNRGEIGPEVDDYKIVAYDFIEEMNNAILKGWGNTVKAI